MILSVVIVNIIQTIFETAIFYSKELTYKPTNLDLMFDP